MSRAKDMVHRSVVVVSNSPETVDGVTKYLQRIGAVTSAITGLDAMDGATGGADAVLLFADDYPSHEVARAFVRLRTAHPTLRGVVVTEDVASFAPNVAGEEAAGYVVVLQRPAWGWMLVDAIRGGSDG